MALAFTRVNLMGSPRVQHQMRTGDFGAGPVFQFLVGGVPHDLADAVASMDVVDPASQQLVWTTGFATVNAALGRFTRYMLPPDLNRTGRWQMRPVSALGVEGDWFDVEVLPGFAFEMRQLPGCVFWTRPDAGVTVAGGGVTAVADRSDAGNDLAVAGVGANVIVGSIGGRASLKFQAGKYLSGAFAGLPANTGFTEILVARVNVLPAAYGTLRMLHDGNMASMGGFTVYHLEAANPPIAAVSLEFQALGYVGGVPDSSQIGYAMADVTNRHCWTIQHDLAGRTIAEDGVAKHTLVIARTTEAITIQALGVRASYNDLPLECEILEDAIFSRVLTVDELAVVHAYVEDYHGIVMP